MNVDQLKAESPALYDQIFTAGKNEGFNAGITSERKRVSAHLKLGGKFNALDVAVKNCTDGVDVNDPEAMADYMGKLADSRDLAATVDDRADLAAIVSDSPKTDEPAAQTEAEKEAEWSKTILAQAAANLGLEMSVGI